MKADRGADSGLGGTDSGPRGVPIQVLGVPIQVLGRPFAPERARFSYGGRIWHPPESEQVSSRLGTGAL